MQSIKALSVHALQDVLKQLEILSNSTRGMHIGYWWESQKERDHYEDQDIGAWIILKYCLREMEWGGMDWIDLV
jgi:hypothetical protein